MTHAEIIKNLGDTRHVAEALSLPLSTVSAWKKRGISRDARWSIARLALAKSVALPADFLVPLN